jgi:glycosyltransferase involved in cell wall biosynthesis
MACGVPTIVSENTFAHDVITDSVDGYVVPIRDADAIAERLLHLHAEPDARHAMGIAARRTAEQFSWQAFGQRVAKVLTTP